MLCKFEPRPTKENGGIPAIIADVENKPVAKFGALWKSWFAA